MKKRDFEDDGRTIADMSGLERPSLFPARRASRRGGKASPDAADAPAPVPEQPVMNKRQNRSYMAGAVMAGLLIAGVFIACGAIAIWLMTVLWH